MKIERKREIRSLIRTIPDLVRAGLVQQAFDTEKVIAATFDFSEEFLEKLGGIPQNHIEKIQETYRDILQKAFNTGFKNAEIKLKSTKLNKELVDEELDREIQIKVPMPYGIKTDLVTLSQEEIQSYLTVVPDKDTILSQFNKDIDLAYLDGVKEYLRQFPNEFDASEKSEKVEEKKPEEVVVETEEVVVEKESTANVATAVSKDVLTALEKYAKLLGTGDAEKVLRYVLGLGDKGVEVTASADSEKEEKGQKEEKEEKEEKESTNSDTLSKLEAYTKLLKSPEAERVLRHTLGLPPKAVTAGLDEEGQEDKESKIGSYDIEVLKEKIIDLVNKHKVVEGEDLQTVIVECLESGVSEKDPEDAAKAIASKLELETTSDDLDEVFGLADDLADSLTDALELEGTLVFVVTENDDYCLTYSFDAEDLEKHVDEVPAEDKQQLSSLAKLGSSKNLNEIRKASPKVTAHIEAILRNIRNGRVNLVAGSLQLRTNMDDMVYDVFGKPGYKYYKKVIK